MGRERQRAGKSAISEAASVLAQASVLEQARRAYGQRAWGDAYDLFCRADELEKLADDDLQKLAWSAGLSGHDSESLRSLERLYQSQVDVEPPRHAAHTAFWIGFRLTAIGEQGQASAWLQRAQRLADSEPEGCAVQGFVLIPGTIRMIGRGELEAGLVNATRIVELGERFAEPNVIAFGLMLRGRALVRMGEIERGLSLSDEAMLSATNGELAPIVTGLVYCTVIATFQQVYALSRAREWTAALAGWCQAQPQLVPFAGSCLVHRAELMQLGGAWREASEEMQRCSERPRFPGDSSVSEAIYQQAEIARLRGEHDSAEDLYRRASEQGREPQPGLALLRLAQGQNDAALSSLRRVLGSTEEALRRAPFLPAYVEITLACADLDAAREACAELSATAERFATESLGAIAAHARGALLLAEGDAQAALGPLRMAFAVWQGLQAPYIAARIRVLIGRACAALGDRDGEALELGAARSVFEKLGAARDLATLDASTARGPAPSAEASGGNAHHLSARELEVLRLIATGKTNKLIAQQLFVSEKTIDRHVSNIFAKLDVRTRAAATAYAYEQGLV